MSFSIPTLRAYRIVSGASPYDYQPFCAKYNTSSYGIKIDGSSTILSDYFTSCTVTFEYSFFEEVLNLNPTASLTYNIYGNGPQCNELGPYTGTVNGSTSVVLNYPGGCRDDLIDVTVELIFNAPSSTWWNDFCCTPFGLCSWSNTDPITAIVTFSLNE
jgi:hypothetical protein